MTWRLDLWVEDLDLNAGNPSSTMTTVEDDTDLASLTGPRLMDGLTYTETIDDEPWPAQPREQLQFDIHAETAAELEGPRIGSRVACGWRSPSGSFTPPDDIGDPTPWLWSFYGQITSYDLEPRRDGVAAKIVAGGYYHAELAEQPMGTVDYVEESCEARLVRYVDGLAYASVGMPNNDPDVAARPAKRSNALTLIDRLLAGWVQTDGMGGRGRFILRPDTIPNLYPIENEVRDIPGSGWTAVDVWRIGDGPDGPAEATIDAAAIEFGGAWSMRQDLNTTRVDATGPAGAGGDEITKTLTNTDHGAGYKVTRKYETDLVDDAPLERVCQLYLPEDGVPPWHADTFTWNLDQEADGTVIPELGTLTTITGLQARHNPTGETFYTGVLATRRFQLRRAVPRVELTLRPYGGETVIDGGHADASHDLTLDGGPADTVHDDIYDGGAAA